MTALGSKREGGGSSLSQQRMTLPVFQAREKILYLLEKYQTLVLVGETGCGKSTQVPQYLHEAKWTAEGRVVGCLQPRRVAAVSVAQRVAAERGCAIGEEVGYAIRFESCYSELRTRIKYMTEGVLIREMMRDPLLSRYSVIMLDEAHERTVFLDVVVGLLAKVQRRRPDLRIIVSSATLDVETFRDFFNTNRTGDPSKDTATVFTVEGRTYPVEVMYAEAPVANYLTATIDTVVDIHMEKPPGDILVFLTGRDEVEGVVKQLRDRLEQMRRPAHVLPLHGALPAREQFQVRP
jgi:ATP-dependent RNA helicase DDX35